MDENVVMKIRLKEKYQHYEPELEIRSTYRTELADIYGFLEAEDRAKTPGNFLCNFRQIIHAFLSREVIVAYIDDDRGFRMCGFYAAFEQSGGILQVKGSERGRGIGTHLANAGLKRFKRKGVKELIVECAPFESIPFWEKMGGVANPDRPESKYRKIDLTGWKPRKVTPKR